MCGPLQEFNKRLIKSKVRIRIATLFAEKKVGSIPVISFVWHLLDRNSREYQVDRL